MDPRPPTLFACRDAADAAVSLRRHGVAVLLDVLKNPDAWRTALVRELHAAFPEGRIHDARGIGTPSSVPPQTRPCMWQALVGNLPTVWKLRSHPRVCAVNRALYEQLRGVPDVGPMVTSIDGLCATSPATTPAAKVRAAHSTPPAWRAKHPGAVDPLRDWPHADQVGGAREQCIQGQLVLQDTSASFVCSPGSHLLHEEIRAALQHTAPTQSTGAPWLHIKTQHDTAAAADVVAKGGGQWQVPILAPAGAMIVWFSTTIHSARAQDAGDPRWRLVVYVCHRPLREVGDHRARRAHLRRLQRAFAENRMTNHSGARMFSKRPGGRHASRQGFHPRIEAWLREPARMWQDLPQLKPTLTPRIRALLGMPAREGTLVHMMSRAPATKRNRDTSDADVQEDGGGSTSTQSPHTTKRARCMHESWRDG